MTVKSNSWDLRYLDLAKHISQWSKDPSTKVGAVIVSPNNSIRSMGFNGLPMGVYDTEERLNNREIKYKSILHAEANSILFGGGPIGCQGCTIYTYPFQSCAQCSSMIIQSSIKRCVAPVLPDSLKNRWGKDIEIAEKMLSEAKVELTLLNI